MEMQSSFCAPSLSLGSFLGSNAFSGRLSPHGGQVTESVSAQVRHPNGQRARSPNNFSLAGPICSLS